MAGPRARLGAGPPPCQRAAPRGPGGKGPRGQNLGHAQRHHWLMIRALVVVATPAAKRQRTRGRWRSEVLRAATCHTGGSGHPPALPGHARPNTRRAPARDSSGRRTPPLRAVSRAASPFPPTDSLSGGSQGWGDRGELGRRGGAGFGRCVFPEKRAWLAAAGGVVGLDHGEAPSRRQSVATRRRETVTASAAAVTGGTWRRGRRCFDGVVAGKRRSLARHGTTDTVAARALLELG